MTRRNTELMLLCIAAPLVILLFAMVALNEGNRVTLDNLTVPLSMFATFVVAHLAIRKLAPGADPAFFRFHSPYRALALPSSRALHLTWL